MIVLGIETSCDETSAALVDGTRILSNVISSQVKVHEKFGGVVPELASRHHLANITPVLRQTFRDAGITTNTVEVIGATYGPGLVGSLLVGLNTAKALSCAWHVPFVGVNHLEAHLHSIFLDHPQAEMPMLSVIASGGHTSLYFVNTKDDYKMLGQTRDDAIGEAFDKVAKLLGLGYPGGPVIDRIAQKQASNVLGLKRPNFGHDTYDFSYSGLKTAVLYHVHRNNIPEFGGRNSELGEAAYPESIREICRSFQTMAIEILMEPLRKAASRLRPQSVSFSGGVACNSYLREVAHQWGREKGIPVYFPSMVLSTDNAAMVAAVAQHKISQGIHHDMSLNADPALKY